jgi:hypothetical protein
MSMDQVTRDARERDAAASDDAALVRYQAKWDRKLRRLQRAHPAHWHVRGCSDDEVRDAITLRLIELVRAGPTAHAEHAREGEEWGLSVAKRHVAELRRSFPIRSTPMDLRGAPLSRNVPSDEELFLEREADVRRVIARDRAEAKLTRPQRVWLAALRDAASRGAFFASSDELNLSAASRLLGKHRSSAKRAYEELRERFVREKTRLE